MTDEEAQIIGEYFIIEYVLGHREGRPSRLEGELLIQWRGYNQPTWEPTRYIFNEAHMVWLMYLHYIGVTMTIINE